MKIIKISLAKAVGKLTLVSILISVFFMLCLSGCVTIELSQHQIDKIRNRVVSVQKQQVWDEITKVLTESGYTFATEDYDKGLLVTNWKTVDKVIGKAFIAPYTEVPMMEMMISLHISSVDTTFSKISAQMEARTKADRPSDCKTAEVHLKYYDKWFAKLGRRMGVKIPHEGPEAWYRTSQ